MSRYKFFPDPPLGGPSCLSRAWEQYRAEIRAAADRWCDEPTTMQLEGEEPKEYSCGDCAPCEANDILERGEA
jgi:hypothetical protein